MFDFNYQVNAIFQNQQSLNTYWGNLMNQFTPGYKADNISFSDIMGQNMSGKSAKVANKGIIFTQGPIARTNSPTDLAINGNGFFMVSDGAKTHMTRDGRFSIQDGALKTLDGKNVMGYKLNPDGSMASGDPQPIRMEMDPNTKMYGGKYNNIRFDENGICYGQVNETDPLTQQTTTKEEPIFQVGMASVANPSGLKRSGQTCFEVSEASGKMVMGVAGQGALGKINPGSLEMSNVDVAQQSALIMMTKQNYQANFAAFKAMDKLTSEAIGLVR